MPDYWVVVRRGDQELFDLLSAAFRGLGAYTIVADRRAAKRTRRSRDRRVNKDTWKDHKFFVAERVSLLD